jgi:hypothetical protein
MPPRIPSSDELEGIPRHRRAPVEAPFLLRLLKSEIDGSDSPFNTSHAWLRYLEDVDARTTATTLHRWHVKSASKGYAAVWQKLGEWIDAYRQDPLAGETVKAHREFVDATAMIRPPTSPCG